MTSRHKVVLVVGVVVVLGLVAPYADPFVILIITRALVLAILAMSLDILLGFTGLPSLGQAAYLGVGAYLTAILATKYHFGLGWDFWLVIVFGILIGAATAAFFGLFAIRASGVYFLMITLALANALQATPERRFDQRVEDRQARDEEGEHHVEIGDVIGQLDAEFRPAGQVDAVVSAGE